jgi:hypothetical protein
MKIVKVSYYRESTSSTGADRNGYVKAYKKFNQDGQEILGWMRSMAKIKSFGIVEVPKYKTDCLARFIDTSTLKNGHYVLFYKVETHGIKRNWVSLHAPKFGNNSHCTELTALSEASLQKSVMRYKVGQTIADDYGVEAMSKFVERFREAATSSIPGIPGDLLRGMLENEFNIRLEKEYNLEDVQKALNEGMTQDDIRMALNCVEEETYGGIPESLHGKLEKFETK